VIVDFHSGVYSGQRVISAAFNHSCKDARAEIDVLVHHCRLWDHHYGEVLLDG